MGLYDQDHGLTEQIKTKGEERREKSDKNGWLQNLSKDESEHVRGERREERDELMESKDDGPNGPAGVLHLGTRGTELES